MHTVDAFIECSDGTLNVVDEPSKVENQSLFCLCTSLNLKNIMDLN